MTFDSPSRAQTQQSGSPNTVPVREGDFLDDRYQVGHVIGRGASADVYRATDLLLMRTVAVKIFFAHLNDAATLARQRSEMKLLAGLNHANLVTIYDARLASNVEPPLTEGENTYLVMELIEGQTLGEAMAGGTALRPAEVARIGAAVAAALAVVHSGGLVHRDIKPANILMCRSGTVKLSDFGIARLLGSERVTQTQIVVGTPAYFSPEQAIGEQIGPATDIYALGLVLLEALSGTRVFTGTPLESAVARLNKDPQIPVDLPDGWPQLLHQMTDRDPGSRPTAQQVADRLSAQASPSQLGARESATVILPVSEAATVAIAAAAPTAVRSTPLTTTQEYPLTPARRRRRTAILMGLLGALAVSAIVVLTGVMSPSTPGEPANSGRSSTSQPPVQSGTTTAGPSGTTTAAPSSSEPVTPTQASSSAASAPSSVTPTQASPSASSAQVSSDNKSKDKSKVKGKDKSPSPAS